MTPPTKLPTVAIVGRPNVGKSTLFNRLVGERRAITSDISGTTRDRITADVTWNGRSFTLMDMGGLDEDLVRQHQPDRVIERQVVEHVLEGITDADIILFVVDARMDLTQLDHRAAQFLRRSRHPVILVANKAEQVTDSSQIAEVFQLGFGEPLLVSSNHGTGTGDLLDAITGQLTAPAKPASSPVRVAIVGRPNVGKSSLVNRIAGEKISIVSDIPGTTRDAVDTDVAFGDQVVRLIDTAGIRRSGKVNAKLDIYAVTRARKAIERADVSVLVLGADEPAAKQDQSICARAIKAGTGLVLVANKWDLIKGEAGVADRLLKDLHRDFVFLPWAPVIFTSATTGEHVEVILEQALQAQAERSKRVDGDDLAAFVRRLALASPPPPAGGKPVSVVSVTQTGTCPPTFSFILHGAQKVHFSYRRFLERSLRERYGFIGTPIRLNFEED